MTPDETRARFPTLVDFIDMIKAEFGPGVKVKYLHNAETGDTLGKPGEGFVSAFGDTEKDKPCHRNAAPLADASPAMLAEPYRGRFANMRVRRGASTAKGR